MNSPFWGWALAVTASGRPAPRTTLGLAGRAESSSEPCPSPCGLRRRWLFLGFQTSLSRTPPGIAIPTISGPKVLELCPAPSRNPRVHFLRQSQPVAQTSPSLDSRAVCAGPSAETKQAHFAWTFGRPLDMFVGQLKGGGRPCARSHSQQSIAVCSLVLPHSSPHLLSLPISPLIAAKVAFVPVKCPPPPSLAQNQVTVTFFPQ